MAGTLNSGRRPDPLHVLKKRGSRRATAKREKAGAGGSSPLPPAWLHGYALRVWRRTAKYLAKRKALDQLNRDTLACYCLAVADVRDAEQILKAEGLTFETTTAAGDLVKKAHPMVSVRNQAMKNVLAFAGHYGLTPATRARLGVPDEPEQTAAAAFFGDSPVGKIG